MALTANINELDTLLSTVNALPVRNSGHLQNKTITPSTSSQSVVCDSGFDGLGTITVNAIQTESPTYTQNGTYNPSTGKYFSKVVISVPYYEGEIE